MKKNKVNFKGGFTLIELLVVIAIIGILSSVVLASLNNARIKAKVAAAQSTISSMRAQAEIGVNNGKYIPDLCFSSDVGGLNSLLTSLNTKASKVQDLKCGYDKDDATSQSRAWAVEVEINDLWYCADSTGYAGVSKTTTKTDGSLPTTDGDSLNVSTITGVYDPAGGTIFASGFGKGKSNLDCAR